MSLLTLLVLGHASAADLPWVCSPVLTPEDALPYLDEDGGLLDAWSALQAEAETWVDEGCAWTVTELGEGETLSTCTTAAGAWVSRYEGNYSREGADVYEDVISAWTLEVQPPPGATTWTAVTLSSTNTTMWEAESWSAEATWSGAILALPPDGSFALDDESIARPGATSIHQIVTPACAWGYGQTDDRYVWVDVGGSRYGVNYGMTCVDAGISNTQAWIDDTLYGEVDPTTWALLEGDQDGYSVASGDCDDTDPTVHPCAPDAALDGVDQNCDGIDGTDGDGDGYASALGGGTDCDDADPLVYPGAAEVPYDGVDDDCDGADLTDVDEDGWVATVVGGDDCDDDDATVFPGATEVAGDGIDQDCDGEDLAAAMRKPMQDSQPAPTCGATGASAGTVSLLPVLLLGIRRRRERRH